MLLVSEQCVGCSQCSFVCKRDAIEVEGKARIIPDLCNECKRCIIYCPLDAIKVVDK